MKIVKTHLKNLNVDRIDEFIAYIEKNYIGTIETMIKSYKESFYKLIYGIFMIVWSMIFQEIE